MQGQGYVSVELSAYLDGQLTPEAARWVDRAAAESLDVARNLHDLRRMRTILRAIEPVRAGPDFVVRVLAEARRRGLMRRVVRERMLQGIVRLASAAAAVLLVAAVTGVAVQGFMNQAGPSRPHGTPAGQAAPAVAVAPRPGIVETPAGAGMKAGRSEEVLGKGGSIATLASAAGTALRKGDPDRLAMLDSRARTLNLTVTDLGAGAKEVTAVLADAGITRLPAGRRPPDSAGTLNARAPAAKTAALSAKAGYDELTGYAPVPGASDELRFFITAPPDRIEAVTRRLDSLRQQETADQSSNGLCLAETPRPAAALPKAASAEPPSPPETAAPGEPYRAAEIQHLPNASQIQARQSQAATAPAAQAAGAPAPRNETIIITVRLRRPDTNRSDPGRNMRQ